MGNSEKVTKENTNSTVIRPSRAVFKVQEAR